MNTTDNTLFQANDAARFLKTLTQRPGVYQFLNEAAEVLYVGKARNLKKRVSSYFKKNLDSIKTIKLMEHVVSLRIIVTESENSALILEHNLIKEFKPRYNILFRDDKSYPYIYLASAHHYPRLVFYRGRKKAGGRYFGPYPNSSAVKDSLNLLQKIFKIRSCDDSYFAHRTRPCLQYQIKRCTAPCVNLISKEDYQADVQNAVLFLEGKNKRVQQDLMQRMEDAAALFNYEAAAQYRDQLAALQQVQEQQHIEYAKEDTDVIALLQQNGLTCVVVLMIRKGQILGMRHYFPKSTGIDDSPPTIASAFVSQYYLAEDQKDDIPEVIIINQRNSEWLLMAQVLSEWCEHAVKISDSVRGARARWLDMARENAAELLKKQFLSRTHYHERFLALQQALEMAKLPQRLECFDISHTQGDCTVASCVVFDAEHGPCSREYRRFNIKGITKSDDYAAMNQVLTRRYSKAKEKGSVPEVIIVDGGKGQLGEAKAVLQSLAISESVVLGISKGPTRKAGFEMIWRLIGESIASIEPNDAALLLLQEIRDEAHRFAIMGHRKQRAKKSQSSVLDSIPGIGAKKRRELLKHFGGWHAIKGASMEELMKVPGINQALAARIYESLH